MELESEVMAAPAGAGGRLEGVLVANQRRFLAFLSRRLGNPAEAEDVLQSAYVRALDRGVPVEDEALVPWFFKVLRHALIDRARRGGTERRSLERLAGELEEGAEPELRDAVCGCIHDVLPELKPEYASVVRAVDLEERSLAEAAAGAGVTVNNATVRLHRARQALKRQLIRSCGACAAHGCLDCTCPRHQPSGGV